MPETSPNDGKGRLGPLGLEQILALLVRNGLLQEPDALSLRDKAPLQRRRLQRERQAAGTTDIPITWAELVASFQQPAVGSGRITETRIQQAVAEAAGLPYIAVDPLRVDPKLVSDTVSFAYARRNRILPLAVKDGRMTLAVDDPYSRDVIVTMTNRAGMPLDVVVSAASDIQQVLDEVFRFRASVRGAVAELGDGATDFGNLEQLVQLTAGTNVEGDDRHVVHAVDFLMRYALEQRASDLHIEPKRDSSHVRLRIDGVLHKVQELPKVVHRAVVSRIKTMARLDIAEKRRPQDGRIKLAHHDLEVELRISTLPTAFGEKVVTRFFDPQVLFQSLDQLGLFPTELEYFNSFIRRPNGLILVTGPTGSGKTTTLYSGLRAVASPTVNVCTIEDPIEMVVDAFNQTAVNTRLGLTFDSLLRTLLRQDPDVIMVGEVRDGETARNAIQAALTGHLVFATVHTNDAPSTIGRMIDLGAEPFMLASTLVGVVAQRLIRRVCMSCRQEGELSAEQATALGLQLAKDERFPVFEGVGCAKCRGTGLKGRIGVFEVMPVNEKLKKQITEGADAGEMARQAVRDGMLTLRQAAIKKLALGLTSFDEVLRVTADSDY
ncbi:MAG TPA: type II secretion system protein E [Myxococcales bacterium]|nr:type II secretion system protein E [Myxococcales bacterium]HAN31097.1 type II secretion system protein E [Myxococcales bacterium]